MATMPEFMQRRVARRTGSDVTRLASSFKMQTGALADQYQSEFAKYQQMVAEKMAPYQAAVADYQSRLEPAYQTELTAYNERLANFQQQLAAISADPVTERVQREVVGRKWYGKKIYGDVTYFDPKPIPEFKDKAPELPNLPTAPEVQAFDSTALETKGKQLQSDFNREIGERRAARMGAVQRRQRTLLGEVKP